MKRQIRWTDQADDGVKVRIRVSIHGGNIKWQFQRKEMDVWDYDSTPTPAQWDELERRVLGHYQRGNVAADKDLALIRAKRKS